MDFAIKLPVLLYLCLQILLKDMNEGLVKVASNF